MRGDPLVVSGDKPNSVVVLGPTAAGKTALGVAIARAFGGEIISADSRQVYRGLDIGSGKDLGEYGTVPYHLIDVADLSLEYSVFDFQRDFTRAFADITARGRLPVVVGGTGLYLDSVLRGYRLVEVPANEPLRCELARLSLAELVERLLSLKKEVHNRTDLLDRDRLIRAIEIAEFRREPAGQPQVTPAQGETDPCGTMPEQSSENPSPAISFRPLVLGVRFERSELRARIRARLDARICVGLVGEVQNLHEKGIDWERLERLGLEYRATARYLRGCVASQSEYADRLYTEICQFAKRQETWFRGMERKGVTIRWIERGDIKTALEAVGESLAEPECSSVGVAP